LKTVGIVAFAFGAPHTIRSNRRIAQIASQRAWELNGRVYTQPDIHVEESTLVEYIEEKPDNPSPTLRIARGCVQWAIRCRLTVLWVVAAKPHLWRALRDIRAAIREARVRIEVRVCQEIKQYPEESWFCPDSTQYRTQSREAWNRRERILKLMPFCVYKIVAS